MISEFAVHSYFAHAQSRGWHLRSAGSLTRGWHAVYSGKLRDYSVFLHVDDDWIYFQCEMLQVPPKPDCRAALHQYLLRLNADLFWAKMALVPADDGRDTNEAVVLIVECPLETFGPGTFRLMTESVATYAEEYAREVEVIALDAPVAALITTGAADWQRMERTEDHG